MPGRVRLGLRLPTSISAGPGASPLPRLVELARAAEGAGFDSLWVPDRAGDPDTQATGALEAYTLLGALATATERARLGALSSPVGNRPPSVLAKQVTCLDVLSGGRAVLGLAVGTARRGRHARLEEAVSVCRAMFEHAESTVNGRWFHTERAANRPSPRHAGGPPIVVAGRSGRRLVEVALRVADAMHVETSTTRLRRLVAHVAARHESSGRPLRPLWVTAGVILSRGAWSASGASAVVEAVGLVLEAGAHGVVLDAPVGVRPDAVAGAGEALVRAYGATAPTD